MGTDTFPKSVEIVVSQRYKDFVVRRQYGWFWIVIPVALGGANLVYYLLCLAFHWTWKLHFQGDMVLPLLGLVAYMIEAKNPWRYEINKNLFQNAPRPPIMGEHEAVFFVRFPHDWGLGGLFRSFEIHSKRSIKLFVITPKTRLANLREIAWAKTEVTGFEQAEWHDLLALKLTVLPASHYVHWLVYSPSDEKDIRTKVIPLIEKYQRSYRQELWADKLR